MNFEIAPKDKWLIESPYNLGVMHCFFLEHEGKKGWRLPTAKEADVLVNIIDPTEDAHKIAIPPQLEEFYEYWYDMDSFGFWTLEDNIDKDPDDDDDHLFTVIPVRDIK